MTAAMWESSAFDADAVEWRDELDEQLVCVAVQDVTHDVRSFVLRPAEPAALRFLPGQYLTLTVQVDGQPLSRCYTIASSPLTPDELTITVKRVPGGPVSNWLHDHLRPGDSVAVTGPNGLFSMANHPAPRYLFLSAGSGITPLMSMLRTVQTADEAVDVVFVHSARTPVDIVFRDELCRIEAENPGVRVVVVCEGDAPDEPWGGPRGRLDLPMLYACASDLADREIFTCGPAPYMDSVRDLLARSGADPARCHEESFHLSAGVAAGDAGGGEVAAGAPTYTVELRRSGRVLGCSGGTSVLAAVAEAGVSLPSSCQEGVCGTCKTTLLSGSVDMQHAGGIRPREIAQDKILLCCSTPLEDLVLDA